MIRDIARADNTYSNHGAKLLKKHQLKEIKILFIPQKILDNKIGLTFLKYDINEQ